MEIHIGDVFSSVIYKFKVIQIKNNYINCEVYFHSRIVGKSLEHKNTLLRMQKLSSLEKELM
jgi:hypothetical protein